MVIELCEDNVELLGSVTVLYFNPNKNKYKEEELISILSKYINNLIVADSIEDAKNKAEGRDIDILITDFSLSDEESINFPLYIRRCNPSCSIIVYASENDSEHVLQAINMKVDKYIPKPSNFNDIIISIIYLAEHAFTLKALYYAIPEESTHLDTESYDLICQSIDELRDVIAKMASKHSMEYMPMINAINDVIKKMKYLLKNSY